MTRKIFVCILTILLITSSINIGGFTQFSSKKVDAKKEINIPKTVEKVGELEELRESNTKTFINSDGTYTKEIYTEDIHFEENGQLKNISNTPELNNEEDKGDFKYKNKDNRFSVKFAKDTKKKNLYKLKMDGETIQVQLLNPKSTEATSSKGIITYENILENVDFTYSIGNSNVKEDIYLTKKDSARKFQFYIKTSLEPKKENGAINFYNKANQVAWVMTPPFMEDANGKYSEDISMDLESYKNGYLVTIIPDSGFLDDEDTVFPVRIDPSVTIGGASNNTLDTYVMSYYSNNNYYLTPELRTGYASSTRTNRSYMNFSQSLPNLNGKLLVKAELKLYKWSDIGSVIPTNVYANRITTNWDSTNVTWNTQPGIDGSVSYGSTSATGSARWLSMDLTSLVDGWLKGHYPNYGVVLRSTSEGTAGTYQKYNASESASNKPYLAITYSDPPSGLNAVPYSYKDGTGYVDLSWSPVEGATGFKVQIFNGRGYEAFNVGNTTWWTTRGKKLWPTRAQIDSGQYGLRTGGDGRELPENPSYLYAKCGGVYGNSTNYWFRVTAYNGYGETDIWGNGVVPTIPDQTKPTAPTAVQITNDRFNSFTIGWQPSTDLDGSGIAKYRVFMGDQPGVANIVNGQETTNQYFTYSGALIPRKTYYAWVQAIDNSANVSDNSVPTEKMARKEFDAQIESYSLPGETDIDNAAAGENLWFDVRNTGTTTWTNDLNISLSVTSTAPDGSAPMGFVGYLNTGEVVKPNEVKRFYVNWKPTTAVIGSYRLKAVVGKGTDPTYINPTENIVDRNINVKDLKAPTGKVAINENAPYATDKNVSVKVFDVYDNAVGDKYVQFANGPENADANTLSFSESMPVTQSTQLYNWVLKDQDGKQFVYAKFSDKSGNVSGSFSDSIILDRTLPEIKLSNVVDGDYLSGTKKMTGSITDQDLASYKLEYRNKNDETAGWNLIAEKNTAVTDGDACGMGYFVFTKR